LLAANCECEDEQSGHCEFVVFVNEAARSKCFHDLGVVVSQTAAAEQFDQRTPLKLGESIPNQRLGHGRESSGVITTGASRREG
jgi:hypothetical protein